jgi:hypothetical protein
MANVFFVKEGKEEDRLVQRKDVNIERILEIFTKDRLHYAGGNIPMVDTDREDLTPYRDPIYVYIKISSNEASQTGLSEGYYFVKDVRPSDWDKQFK